MPILCTQKLKLSPYRIYGCTFSKNGEMKYIKSSILIIFIFVFLIIAFTSTTSGDRDQTITEVNATYEILAEEEVVHVFKNITFTNYDAETRYWQGYYSNINQYIPENAINIHVYDNMGQLVFQKLDEQSNYYAMEFNKDVWHGENYSFTIEYDIDIHKNIASFRIKEHGDLSKIKVIIPQEYEVYMNRDDYLLRDIPNAREYIFDHDQQELQSLFVDAIKNKDVHTITGTSHLNKRDVEIKVNYYEGEEEWAKSILKTTIESLPIMEKISHMDYPVNYDITITQVTTVETNGYGGVNKGKDGIYLLHTEEEGTLIHELAHYWTRAHDYEHAWTEEGCADLYTYLVLNQTHPDVAVSRKNAFFKTYESMEQEYDLDLSEWSIPDSINQTNYEMINYGYKKSFVTLYKAYEREGIKAIQEPEPTNADMV